jgi:signal transduction histidine kinase/HAMP domain-containing protein
MKLRLKLLLFALIAIIVPIIGIALFSGIFIYRSAVIAEREILEKVIREIRADVATIRDVYSSTLQDFTADDYLESKLYVYSKYWSQIDSSTLEIDIIPLKNEIEKYSLSNQLESVAVYRRGYDKFIQIAVVGRSKNIPDVIYIESIRKYYNQVYFFLYSDGIYLNAAAPVYSSARETGLVLLQRSFDRTYFSMLCLQYGVNFALYSKGRFIFSSLPGVDAYHIKSLPNGDELVHDTYRYKGQTFNLVLYNFDLGNTVTGVLVIGAPKSSFFQNRQLTIQLAIITLFCLFIPVLTFYLWGSNLIHGIRQLVFATRAVSKGDYSYQIHVGRSDEIGSLSSAFNAMTQALKENNDRLEMSNRELGLLNSYIDAVFQSLLVTTLVIDQDHRIVLANQSAQSSLNLPERATGISIFSIPFFSDHRAEIAGKLDEVFRHGRSDHVDMIEIERRVYSFDFFPVGEHQERISGIVVVIVDITEHLSMERAVVQYEKLAEVGKLAAGIAHEIGNPMGVILNHVQLIATDRLSKEEELQYIRRIESEIKRINSLVEKLLHVSRDESGDMRLVNLSDLAEEIIDLFSPKIKRKKIRVLIENHSSGSEVLGNPDSLKQVFFNVLNNAIQSIDHAHGIIRVSIESERSRVRVVIEDNGKGIERAILDRFFDPFVTNKNSTGLGLYMSSKIVKKHNGSISVSSELQKGSVVTLDFPMGGLG